MAKTLEFIKYLGNHYDFVAYVQDLEQSNRLDDIENFSKTPGNKRYLAVKNGPTRIIDFRHFFAAMRTTTKGFAGLAMQTVGDLLVLGILKCKILRLF